MNNTIDEQSVQVLTYKFRLLPTRKQHAALHEILRSQRELYNAALEERIGYYRKTGKGLSLYDQQISLTKCRELLPEMAELPANIQRGTLKRIDEAFRGFFRRAEGGGKAGFPRFRGSNWFSSFDFMEFSGIRLMRGRFFFGGLPGGLRIHFHRPLPAGRILAAKFKRDHKGWSVCLAVRVECAKKCIVGNAAGVDVGIAVLAATSDGMLIPNVRPARRAEKQMRLQQRRLSRCKHGSKRRVTVRAALTRLHAKIANTRSTYLHQKSAMLVEAYDLISVEDLNVKGLARGILARDVHDVAWTKLVQLLDYKAERAGKHLIRVDPKYTSQDCSSCGVRTPKTLAERTHNCPSCGLSLDRDINAARNILSKGVAVLGLDNVAGCGERSTRNIELGDTPKSRRYQGVMDDFAALPPPPQSKESGE